MIICYDTSKGILACQAAVMCSAIGMKEVLVLNGKFQPWNMTSSVPMKAPVRASGTVFDYTSKVEYYAQEDYILRIEEGKSTKQLIDCRADKKEFELRHRKMAVHLPWVLFMDNHI